MLGSILYTSRCLLEEEGEDGGDEEGSRSDEGGSATLDTAAGVVNSEVGNVGGGGGALGSGGLEGQSAVNQVGLDAEVGRERGLEGLADGSLVRSGGDGVTTDVDEGLEVRLAIGSRLGLGDDGNDDNEVAEGGYDKCNQKRGRNRGRSE